MTKWVSDEKYITERVPVLAKLVARGRVWGITTPVFIMFAVMSIVAYLLEQTTVGRSWYAIGFDRTVARLAGLRVKPLQFAAFMISAAISGLAGVIITGRVNSGSPEAGPPYLLPAFAAAFLGATQFRGGRFNVWGAIVAVLDARHGRGRAVVGRGADVGAEHLPGRGAHRRDGHRPTGSGLR